MFCRPGVGCSVFYLITPEHLLSHRVLLRPRRFLDSVHSTAAMVASLQPLNAQVHNLPDLCLWVDNRLKMVRTLTWKTIMLPLWTMTTPPSILRPIFLRMIPSTI